MIGIVHHVITVTNHSIIIVNNESQMVAFHCNYLLGEHDIAVISHSDPLATVTVIASWVLIA